MTNPIHSIIKRVTYYSVYILIASLVISSQASASLLIDRIVAVVENEVITENELLERINVIRTRSNGVELPSNDVLAEQVLQRMIIERLQVDWGERRGIEIDDLTLDQAMRNLAERNKLSLDQFRSALLEQGIDYISFRDQVRTEMMINQVTQRAVHSNIQVTDKEIEMVIQTEADLMDRDSEFRLAHILIQLPENPSPSEIDAAKGQIEKIHTDALSGASFTQLAITHSQAQDALEGGDLGWRARNQLPSIFSNELSKVEPGGVSKILRSGSGFHIFKLIDVRGGQNMMVNQYLTRHILLRPNAIRDDAQTEEQLRLLRARIVNGDDFATIARAHSEDPGSAVDGGVLGWQTADTFVPRFRQMTETLTPGELSQPFKSQFGWHILEVMDTRKFDNSDGAMRSQAREILRQRKIEDETELWLRQLRDEAYVENRLTSSPDN
jgi:peptidyl-prolyl cis-trans isomerase SurA